MLLPAHLHETLSGRAPSLGLGSPLLGVDSTRVRLLNFTLRLHSNPVREPERKPRRSGRLGRVSVCLIRAPLPFFRALLRIFCTLFRFLYSPPRSRELLRHAFCTLHCCRDNVPRLVVLRRGGLELALGARCAEGEGANLVLIRADLCFGRFEAGAEDLDFGAELRSAGLGRVRRGRRTRGPGGGCRCSVARDVGRRSCLPRARCAF